LVAWIRGGGFFAGIKSYFVGGDPVAAAKAAAADAKANAARKAARRAAQAAEVQQFLDSQSRGAVQDLVRTTGEHKLSQLGDEFSDDAWRAAGWAPQDDGADTFQALIRGAKQGNQDDLNDIVTLLKNSGNIVNSKEFKGLPVVSQKLLGGIISGKPRLLSPAELQASIASVQADAAVQQKAGQAAQATMKAGADAVNAANAAAKTAIAPRYNWQPGTANQIAKSLGLGDKVAAYNLDKFGRVTSILNPQTREYVPVPTDMITSQDQLLKPGFGIKESSYKKMMKNIYL
jgi:hypothetical protein